MEKKLKILIWEYVYACFMCIFWLVVHKMVNKVIKK